MTTDDVQILFADLQPELLSGSRTVEPAQLARAAGVLAEVGRILRLPMVFSLAPQDGKPAGILPELARYMTPANTFSRGPASPFLDPPTVAALAASGRRTLVISGFSGEVVVLHAALDGLAAGYAVQLPLDAIGSQSERTESAILRQIERAGGVSTSIWTLVSRLEPDFQQPPGSQVFEMMKTLATPLAAGAR